MCLLSSELHLLYLKTAGAPSLCLPVSKTGCWPQRGSSVSHRWTDLQHQGQTLGWSLDIPELILKKYGSSGKLDLDPPGKDVAFKLWSYRKFGWGWSLARDDITSLEFLRHFDVTAPLLWIAKSSCGVGTLWGMCALCAATNSATHHALSNTVKSESTATSWRNLGFVCCSHSIITWNLFNSHLSGWSFNTLGSAHVQKVNNCPVAVSRRFRSQRVRAAGSSGALPTPLQMLACWFTQKQQIQ